jgi:hypothetical protein
MLGLGNTVGNFAGILVNASTGYILELSETPETGWTAVFMLAIAINLFGCVVFALFCPGQVLFN